MKTVVLCSGISTDVYLISESVADEGTGYEAVLYESKLGRRSQEPQSEIF